MNELVKLIKESIPVYPNPCVNISGGIDSTIILHHLHEKTKEPIYTYTVGFPDQPTEFEPARKVAEHYDTIHREIEITHLLDDYTNILPYFSQPRFNLWPYWLAVQAFHDKRKSCYIGEGGDEHFGGYWYKHKQTYMEYWSNFFTYVLPTYQTCYDKLGINLVVPFHPANLSWQKTFKYWDQTHQKLLLKEAYKNVLPDFVLSRQKKHNAGN
jgi:asparagine synthetase B (glutamine-hydrolysing)